MNKKKENVQIWIGFLVFKGWDFRTVGPDLEKDEDIEDEGYEDKDDAAEDPGGKGSQTDWIGRSRPKSWDEEVDQHLDGKNERRILSWGNHWERNDQKCEREKAATCRIGGWRDEETHWGNRNKQSCKMIS